MPKAPRQKTDATLQVRLGATVKARRLACGLTQEELAWRAEMHRTYLADIERGVRNVTLKTLGGLASALDVSIASLLPEPAERAGESPKSTTASDSGELGEIVLVDGNASDVETTLRVFREANFCNPVRVFRDGEHALAYLRKGSRKRRPQMVLLDLHVSHVSGASVLKKLRNEASTQGIPVVVLVMNQHQSDLRETRRLDAEHIVLKPVAFEDLYRAAPKLGLQWALLGPA